MNNEARMKFRIGVLVLGALLLLALLVILFGEFPNFLTGQMQYVVKLPQAPGVQEGTAVRKSGIRIGEVSSVELDAVSGEVTLLVTVQKKYQLRTGDAAVLGRGLVLGDASLNFVPDPRKPGPPAPNGHSYSGQVSGDLNKALAEAKELVPVIMNTSDDIRKLTKAVQEVIPDFRKTASEIQVAANSMSRTADTVDNLLRTNSEKITQAIDNISRTTARIGDLITVENQERIARIIRNVESASSSLNGFLSAENRDNFSLTLKSVRETSDRISNVFTEENQRSLTTIINNLKTSTDRVAKILSVENERAFSEALQGIRATSERLVRFLSDDNEKNLAATLKNLRGSSEKVDAVVQNFDSAVTDARKALKSINDRVESTGNQINETLTEARKTIQSVNSNVEVIGKDLQETVKEGRQVVKRINESAGRFDEAMVHFRDVAKMVNERGPVILKNLEQGTAQLGTISANVSDFTKALLQGDGTVRRLIVDPSLYNSLNDAARGLNATFHRMEKITRDVEVFADKIARHPEVLGLRGAVSPGSGVK